MMVTVRMSGSIIQSLCTVILVLLFDGYDVNNSAKHFERSVNRGGLKATNLNLIKMHAFYEDSGTKLHSLIFVIT